jgi:hypothetical protein
MQKRVRTELKVQPGGPDPTELLVPDAGTG